MTVGVLFAVLGAGMLHALWNAMTKSQRDLVASFALLNLASAAVCWAIWPAVGLPRGAAWPYIAGSTVGHLAYESFLLASYRRSDFSLSYPVARGAAPVFVSLGGLAFANEHLGLRGAGGVGLVVAGIASLAVARGRRGERRHVVWALATGAAIAVYTVVDGLGVRASHDALRYGIALFAIQSTLWTLGAVARHGVAWWPEARVAARGLASGVLADAGYLVILWAQQRAPLGEVSAVRETGVLWAAVIGVLVFGEGRLRRVAVPAAAVVAGVALLSG
ncbi:MAG TPA: hypothetical protein VGS61_00770 [Acidimicrobiales bacterium]|nr:hypothetical protein [Acidimicrobiales bacterium]